ncbi:hypothetical protein niasHT_006548 [Heterodera trifolii]|uniref:G-protein coupled receptors family 1 profile domain-containing protein n=1 Tax=Heterodera trifolii TaxID=157864 RepID=A0ABD2LRB7_9BILA
MAEASSNCTQISDTAISVAYAMAFLELGTFIPTIPILAFCSSIVFKTSILHRNLKGILLAQLFGIMMNLWPRVFLLVDQIFVAKNIFLVPSNFITCSSTAAIIFSNMAGHVLIVERICATIYVNTYEKYSSWVFTIVWLLITFGIITNVESMTMFYQVLFLAHAFNDLALPVAMLCYHPLLNRKAKASLAIIKKLFKTSAVSPQETAQPLDTDGRPISERIQQENQDKEAYFKQLASAWGD